MLDFYQQFLVEHRIVEMQHFLYSPDPLAPNDIFSLTEDPFQEYDLRM